LHTIDLSRKSIFSKIVADEMADAAPPSKREIKMGSNMVLHDFFRFPGGGENVAMALGEHFNADILTSEIDDKTFPEGYFQTAAPKIIGGGSFLLNRWSKTIHISKQFESIQSTHVDHAFFSGSLSILAQKNIVGRKILYCHTPPRILFDQKEFYIRNQKALARPLWLLMLSGYKKKYIEAAKAMDIIVANSVNVQKRIRKYMGMDSEVIYPPVETGAFKWMASGDYYLSTARTDISKRVEIIVKAFIRMPDKKLIVTSGGSELEKLKKMARDAKNIFFTGWVETHEMIKLIGHCMATIYIPMDEDFGMSPVESMAAGKPVIGIGEGGLLETIRHECTGALIEADGMKNRPESDMIHKLMAAVRFLTPKRALEMRRACQLRARMFSRDIFFKKMDEMIARLSGSSHKKYNPQTQ